LILPSLLKIEFLWNFWTSTHDLMINK
jgi:hypothetical protein